ncbi:MAG: hypothetical protein LBC60_04880 [Spirochaetaceae bacterium]|jgi:hypothetical protein|nr:hypothetical protein [Spirochaetaceae bacterium]
MNFKLSGIAAGIAFVLSLLIGLISGAGILALVRAFILGAIFFILSAGVYRLILHFLPELLESPQDEEDVLPSGSMVDISLEAEPGEEPADTGEHTPEGSSGISSFENPSGLDQKENIEYTNQGGMDKNPPIRGEESAPSPDSVDLGDELPDLESLSAAFSPGGRGSNEDLSEFIISSDDSTGRKSGDKSDDLNSDFSTHDMASAIQTILKRE